MHGVVPTSPTSMFKSFAHFSFVYNTHLICHNNGITESPGEFCIANIITRHQMGLIATTPHQTCPKTTPSPRICKTFLLMFHESVGFFCYIFFSG